jgi:hypothetical protein
LAGIIVERSCALRDAVKVAHAHETERAEGKATAKATARAIAQARALSGDRQAVSRVARLLGKHARAGMTRDQLSHKIHSRDREFFDAALTEASLDFDEDDRLTRDTGHVPDRGGVVSETETP